jgi:predicted transcriptional regulator
MKNSEMIDEIGFLTASETRASVLSVLVESGPQTKAQLREQFGVSRTTLMRNLDKLEDRGWICEDTSNVYRLTQSGELVANALMECAETVETAYELQSFLRWTDPSEFDLDPELLADAEITVAEPPNPYAPLDEHVRTLREAESFRGCLSVIGRDALETVHDRIEEIEEPWELVITEDVLEMLQSDPSYNGGFEALRAQGGIEIYVHEEEIPFFVGLFDDVVQIGVENDQGVPQALVSVDNKRVRDWAQEYYSRFRDQAEMLMAL